MYEPLDHPLLLCPHTDTKYDAERALKRQRKEKDKKIKEYRDALKKKKQKQSEFVCLWGPHVCTCTPYWLMLLLRTRKLMLKILCKVFFIKKFPLFFITQDITIYNLPLSWYVFSEFHKIKPLLICDISPSNADWQLWFSLCSILSDPILRPMHFVCL